MAQEPIKRETPLPTFDEAKYYSVQLYKPVIFAGRTFSPANKILLRGDVARVLIDSIYTAEEQVEN